MTIEPAIIKLCVNRDRKGEYELYKQVYSYLMSICVRYSKDKDSASEMLNVAYLKILNNIQNYKPEISFKAWIRRITVNTLIDEYRKNKRQRENVTYVEEYYDNTDYSEVNEALSKISCEQIHKLIAQLPNATKEVFNLYVIDGYNHREIAELLGISEGTSKWHLSEARQKLKQKIEQQTLSTI